MAPDNSSADELVRRNIKLNERQGEVDGWFNSYQKVQEECSQVSPWARATGPFIWNIVNKFPTINGENLGLKFLGRWQSYINCSVRKFCQVVQTNICQNMEVIRGFLKSDISSLQQQGYEVQKVGGKFLVSYKGTPLLPPEVTTPKVTIAPISPPPANPTGSIEAPNERNIQLIPGLDFDVETWLITPPSRDPGLLNEGRGLPVASNTSSSSPTESSTTGSTSAMNISTTLSPDTPSSTSATAQLSTDGPSTIGSSSPVTSAGGVEPNSTDKSTRAEGGRSSKGMSTKHHKVASTEDNTDASGSSLPHQSTTSESEQFHQSTPPSAERNPDDFSLIEEDLAQTTQNSTTAGIGLVNILSMVTGAVTSWVNPNSTSGRIGYSPPPQLERDNDTINNIQDSNTPMNANTIWGIVGGIVVGSFAIIIFCGVLAVYCCRPKGGKYKVRHEEDGATSDVTQPLIKLGSNIAPLTAEHQTDVAASKVAPLATGKLASSELSEANHNLLVDGSQERGAVESEPLPRDPSQEQLNNNLEQNSNAHNAIIPVPRRALMAPRKEANDSASEQDALFTTAIEEQEMPTIVPMRSVAVDTVSHVMGEAKGRFTIIEEDIKQSMESVYEFAQKALQPKPVPSVRTNVLPNTSTKAIEDKHKVESEKNIQQLDSQQQNLPVVENSDHVALVKVGSEEDIPFALDSTKDNPSTTVVD